MERLWNHNYCKVMTANFALFFAFYLLTPLLPLYLHETFGATKDVIGFVLSGYTLVALLFRPFSGFLVDTFPRKTVLLVAFSMFAIFFAGYLVATSLLLFTILRTLHGGPFGAVTVANSTVAIDVLPSSRRNEGIGYYGLSNNLAMAISPTFALFIYTQTHNFQLLFWLSFAIATFGLVVDSTIKMDKPRQETSAPHDGRHRYMVHAVCRWSDAVTSSGWQSLAPGTPYPQCRRRNGHLPHRIYPVYRHSQPYRLLWFRHPHRTGQRTFVASFPEHDYQCGSSS